MKKRIRAAIAVVLMISVALMLSGCWDQQELDEVFIVTGLALDKNPDPALIDLTIQVGKPKPKSSDSGGSSQDPFIIIKVTEPSVQEGLKMANEDSSRFLLLQHNQVILFGTEFAEAGVRDKIDLFVRDQEMRMEMLILVIDGRAEKALTVKTDQEETTGVYLSRLIKDMKGMSPYGAVRLFDFISRLQDATTSTVVPYIHISEENGKPSITINGMAVFKDDRMIGHFTDREALGFLYAMGDVKQSGVAAETEIGRAVFDIQKLDVKRKVTIRPDGGVKVTLSANGVLRLSQLSGFYGMQPVEIMTYLKDMAQTQIQNQIYQTFDISRAMNADIYGFGASVYQHYPKIWPDMVRDWDTYYQDIDLEVQVNVRIPQTGKIVKSLEMDVTSYAN